MSSLFAKVCNAVSNVWHMARSLPQTVKEIGTAGIVATSVVYFGPMTVVSFTPSLFEMFLAYSVVYKHLHLVENACELVQTVQRYAPNMAIYHRFKQFSELFEPYIKQSK